MPEGQIVKLDLRKFTCEQEPDIASKWNEIAKLDGLPSDYYPDPDTQYADYLVKHAGAEITEYVSLMAPRVEGRVY